MNPTEADGAGESEPVLHDIADHDISLLGNATAFRQLIGAAAS
ncbi:hypothetical protein [Brachybacterium tyrofermentans]|uniref:Uncharacterized protein n=1 Tax=Brachybacterium tyrofermentans TaxID=47848 RepID=A0ABW0FJJ7_9MICO|nr:hypothetical protein [Brachybacterium tyrofermentans]